MRVTDDKAYIADDVRDHLAPFAVLAVPEGTWVSARAQIYSQAKPLGYGCAPLRVDWVTQ